MQEVLYVVAFIGTLLEGIGVGVGRISPGWIGLSAFILTFLI